jgi:excinuclease ABC subunit A
VFDGTTADLRRPTPSPAPTWAGASRWAWASSAWSPNTPRLILEGAREHNLKNVTVEFPLQRLVTVTGVSGSGKSSLIQDVLAPALLRHFGKATEAPGAHDRLLGADHLATWCLWTSRPSARRRAPTP